MIEILVNQKKELQWRLWVVLVLFLRLRLLLLRERSSLVCKVSESEAS